MASKRPAPDATPDGSAARHRPSSNKRFRPNTAASGGPSRKTPYQHRGSEKGKHPPRNRKPSSNGNTHTHNPHPNRNPDAAAGPSINKLKASVRSLRRLLAPANPHVAELPAPVRIEKERALASAEYELSRAQRKQQRAKLISRYHHIRFFDRQKASKRLKKVEKVLREHEGEGEGEAEDEESIRLRRCSHIAEINLKYTLFFPLDRPYVSLFPSAPTESAASAPDDKNPSVGDDNPLPEPTADDPAHPRGDPDMWLLVEKCAERGQAALDALREGTLLGGGEENAMGEEEEDDEEPRAKKAKRSGEKERAQKSKKSDAKAAVREGEGGDGEESDSDNGSGGAFFA